MSQQKRVIEAQKSSYAERIAAVREHMLLTQEEFGTRLGKVKQTIYRYETGERAPSGDVLEKITRLVPSINPAWLLAGEGPMYREGAGQVSDGDVIYIPRLDVQGSAGEGTIVDSEHVKETRPFRREEIARFRTSPENLTIIEVRGESMQPTLNPGDEVMVDLTWPQTVVDGIYAVRVNQTLMLKRVQQLPGNKLVVRSDNVAYEPFEVDGADGEDGTGDFQIIGRVVWGAKRY